MCFPTQNPMFLHYFLAIRYVWCILTVICAIKESQIDAAHEYRSSSFYGCGGAEACTARQLRLPPLCCALLCGCVRWRCLKTGISLVSATTSFFSYSHLKARNPALRRAEQKLGNSHNLCLITCHTEGDDFRASAET